MKNPGIRRTDAVKLAMTGLIGDRRKTITADKLYARVVDQSKRLGQYPPAWTTFVDQVRAHGGTFSGTYPFIVRLPQRKLLNPGAAWHQREASSFEELSKSTHDPEKRSRFQLMGGEHRYSEGVSEIMKMPNPRKRKNPKKQIKGSYVGTLLAIGTIVGVAWLAKKYKEQEI